MVNVAIQENHEDDYADSPPSMARSSLLRDLPTTERGLRTRAALIAAARKVFERMGYLDARLIDITRAAKCSAGTFYTYFSSKEEIFAAVLEVAQEDMLHPGMPHVTTEDDPAAIIEASNRAYLQAYQRNAKLMGLLEQVANVDPEFRELRTLRSNAFVRRNARSIARLQANGQADPDLDPLLAARALSGMMSRFAFGHFVTREDRDDTPVTTDEDLVQIVTRLWVNALRIPRPDHDQSGAELELDAGFNYWV
jgi:AcrR family transcriptional regulator